MNLKLQDYETNAWVGLVRTQQTLLNKVEQELKKNGFPPLSWYDVLLELDKAQDGKLRQIEIGERILLSKYNVSRLLDRLEKKKLISRESCSEDARGTFAVITNKGIKLRRNMWPVYYSALKEFFLSKYTANELKQLVKYHERLL